MGVGGGLGLLGHWRGVHLVRGAVGVGNFALIVGGVALAGEHLLYQQGKGLVLVGAGTLDALAFGGGVVIGMRVGNVVGKAAFLLVAAAQILGRGHRGAGVLGVQLQALVLQALGGADGQGSPKGLDAGLGLAHHLVLLHLHQVFDHQVIAAHIVPFIVPERVFVLAAKGVVDAGVGIPGHVAVGGHLGSLGIDLVAGSTAGAQRYHIGAEDLLIGEGGAFNSVPVGLDGSSPAGILDNFAIFSECIVSDGASELVESTLIRVVVVAVPPVAIRVVPLITIILVVRALAVLGVLSDAVLQADLMVLIWFLQGRLICQQILGTVVPFQLQALGKKHAVGLGYLAVFIRQFVHLGTGGQVQVGDVVSLPHGFWISIPVRGRFLGVVLEVLIAGVVVLQLLLILGALVHGHGLRFCYSGLIVQGFDKGLRGHIGVGHGGGELRNNVLRLGILGDLQITDPKLLVILEALALFLYGVKQFFLCGLLGVVVTVLYRLGDGVVDRRVDLQGLFAQVAVVDGNGAAVRLLIGGSIGRGIQSDLAISFRELLSQHSLDGGFVQVRFFLKGKGVGDGLAVLLLGSGVGTVSVLLQVLVGIAVLDLEGSALQGPGGVPFGFQDLLVEAFVRLLGLGGLGLHGPGGFGNVVEGGLVDLVALFLQILDRFVLCLGKSLPSGGFLFWIGEGDRFVLKGVDGLGGDAVLLGGHGVDLGAVILFNVLHTGVIDVGPLRHGLEAGTSVNNRLGKAALLIGLGPGDGAVGDVGGAGHGGLLYVLGLLAVHGGIASGGGSRIFDTCLSIVEGILLAIPGNDQVAACELDALQFILSELNAILLGRIPQGVLDGLGLGGGFGFVLSDFLAGGLGDLGDLHGVTQSLADGFLLIKGQLFALVVNAVVIAGEALAQTVGQLLVGELLGVFRFLDFIGIFLAVCIGFRIDILAGIVVIVLVLEHFAQLLRRNLDDIRLGLVGVLGSDAWQFDLGGQILIININGALFHLEHQRGLGAGLDRIAGDLVVGGAGDGVAVLVGRGLFLFQGVGGLGVALFVQLFLLLHAVLGDIQQLGNVLSGHFLRFGRAGLFQGQGLGVAVLGGLDLFHGVIAQRGVLISFPVRAHFAKLLVQVDLFALLGVGDGGGGICLTGAGGGSGLGAGGLGGGGDGGVAVLVLAHHGVALLHLGVGVHDGGAGRAVGGLFLGGLADLAVLAGGFVLLAVVDHVTLHIGAVGVLSLVRLAGFTGLIRLLSGLVVDDDIIGIGAGAERGSLIIFLGLIVLRGNKLFLLFLFALDLAFCGLTFHRSGLGLRGSVILDRVGAFHSMGSHGLCSNTGGQGYGHGSEFQLFVRHD